MFKNCNRQPGIEATQNILLYISIFGESPPYCFISSTMPWRLLEKKKKTKRNVVVVVGISRSDRLHVSDCLFLLRRRRRFLPGIVLGDQRLSSRHCCCCCVGNADGGGKQSDRNPNLKCISEGEKGFGGWRSNRRQRCIAVKLPFYPVLPTVGEKYSNFNNTILFYVQEKLCH